MAGGNVKTFTVDNWGFEVLNSEKTVLVDFWAPWCGPCKKIGPIIEELADEYAGKAVIGKLNVDEQGEVGSKYGIMSIPSLLLFKDGKVIEKMIGFRGKKDLAKLIDTHI